MLGAIWQGTPYTADADSREGEAAAKIRGIDTVVGAVNGGMGGTMYTSATSVAVTTFEPLTAESTPICTENAPRASGLTRETSIPRNATDTESPRAYVFVNPVPSTRTVAAAPVVRGGPHVGVNVSAGPDGAAGEEGSATIDTATATSAPAQIAAPSLAPLVRPGPRRGAMANQPS